MQSNIISSTNNLDYSIISMKELMIDRILSKLENDNVVYEHNTKMMLINTCRYNKNV